MKNKMEMEMERGKLVGWIWDVLCDAMLTD